MENSLNLEALRHGDERAWSFFYQTYSPLVRRILSWPKWRFSRQEQEDLLQEVFIQLIRSVKKYKGEAKITTFVARIVQNNAVSAIRKKTAQKRGDGKTPVALEDLEHFPISEPSSLVEDLVWRDTWRHLEASLEKLEPECRKLIRLRFLEELSYEALSAAYGLPIGTLASRLKRCLLNLKVAFDAISEKKLEKSDKIGGRET